MNLFFASLVFGPLITSVYFYWRERQPAQRTYYQPVRLVDADLFDGSLGTVRLHFSNAAYARLFSGAKAQLIGSRVLKVDAGGRSMGSA